MKSRLIDDSRLRFGSRMMMIQNRLDKELGIMRVEDHRLGGCIIAGEPLLRVVLSTTST
jgi:hypothetical protein